MNGTAKRLADLLGVPSEKVFVKRQPATKRGPNELPDLLVSAGRFKFAVKCKTSGDAAPVAMAARIIARFTERANKLAVLKSAGLDTDKLVDAWKNRLKPHLAAGSQRFD